MNRIKWESCYQRHLWTQLRVIIQTWEPVLDIAARVAVGARIRIRLEGRRAGSAGFDHIRVEVDQIDLIRRKRQHWRNCGIHPSSIFNSGRIHSVEMFIVWLDWIELDWIWLIQWRGGGEHSMDDEEQLVEFFGIDVAFYRTWKKESVRRPFSFVGCGHVTAAVQLNSAVLTVSISGHFSSRFLRHLSQLDVFFNQSSSFRKWLRRSRWSVCHKIRQNSDFCFVDCY